MKMRIRLKYQIRRRGRLTHILCILSVFNLCFFGSVNVMANNTSEEDTTQVYYVRKYKDYFSIRSIVTQKFLNVSFEDMDANIPKLEYGPNLGPFLGLGLYAFDLGLEFSLRLPSSDSSVYKSGNSKGTDLQARIYSRRFGLDASYQDYTGFYLQNPQNFYHNWNGLNRNPQRPDMRISNTSFGFFYIFNPRRYSFPAIYNHSEQQVKSSGSFMMTALFNLFRLKGDSSFIPSVDTNRFTGNIFIRDISVNSYALMPGYSYNFIIKQRVYLSLAIALGASYQTQSYISDQSYNNARFSLATNWRFGLGYNHKRVFAGISFFLQQNNSQFQNIRVTNQSGYVKLFVGFRFKEWGLLKKSINDVLPFLESKL